MVSPRNKLWLVCESGWGAARWPCGLSHTPCTGPKRHEGSSGHSHGFYFLSPHPVPGPLLCLLPPLSLTHLGYWGFCPPAFLCLLVLECPLFNSLLTQERQPPLRFSRVCLYIFWSAKAWRPCLLSLKIVTVHVLTIVLLIYLLLESQ